MVECEFNSLDTFSLNLFSFNRYMVECEYFFHHFRRRVNFVLIDTWWNVNLFGIEKYLEVAFVLIDTWWNVNCRRY